MVEIKSKAKLEFKIENPIILTLHINLHLKNCTGKKHKKTEITHIKINLQILRDM